MRKKIISAILSSLVERGIFTFSQLLVSIIVIYTLPIASYGLIGIVAGYYVFIHFLNVATEVIILRDHKSYGERINNVMYSLVVLNCLKAVCLLGLLTLLIPLLGREIDRHEVAWAVMAFGIAPVVDSVVGPFTVYAATKFKQKLVTKLAGIRAGLNITLSLGMFAVPSLEYLALKEVCVSAIYLGCAFYAITHKLDLSVWKLGRKGGVDWKFLHKSLFSYAIWTHCVGMVTFYMYRSDTFFLSLFESLETIGYYSIALATANVANVLPQLISYQNSVALSHEDDHSKALRMTNNFVRLSFYVGVITILGFVLFGKSYLYLLKGDACPPDTYLQMLCIVVSLVIVKTVASPYNSFINIKGSVYRMFLRVVLPTGMIATGLYYTSAKWWGPNGIALANIVTAIVWLTLQIIEVRRYNYRVDGLFDVKRDLRVIRAAWHR